MNEQPVSLGPLDALLNEPQVVEIMVNSYDHVYVQRAGAQHTDVMEEVPGVFRDDAHLMEVVEALRAHAESLGRRLDAQNPMVDVRLGDKARANVVLAPISAYGPVITIRKFQRFLFEVDDLVRFGSWSEDIITFLRACVASRLNIVVAGGTGAGKTTLLNVLCGMIPPEERVILVENALELNPPKTLKHLVRLESRPPDYDGHGAVSIQDLVINAMRMRPDRIITGEVRAGEVLDIVQAINNGHDGTMCSIHATSPRDVLTRLEIMATMHSIAFPLLTIRQMIASAVDLITYQEKLPDGRRKIMKIAEVTGMQGDVIGLRDLFEFRQTGVEDDGTVTGYFTATGQLPGFLDRFRTARVELPMEIFRPR